MRRIAAGLTVFCLVVVASPLNAAHHGGSHPACALDGGYNAGDTEAKASPMRVRETCTGAFGSSSRFDWYFIPEVYEPTANPTNSPRALYLEICSHSESMSAIIHWRWAGLGDQPLDTGGQTLGSFSVPGGDCAYETFTKSLSRIGNGKPLLSDGSGFWYIQLNAGQSGVYYYEAFANPYQPVR